MLTVEQKQELGYFLGGIAPYGYLLDPEDKNHLVIDEATVSVVKNMFEWYTKDDMTISAITHKLNELEIPSPTALKRLRGEPYPHIRDNYIALWSPRTVRSILKNQIYLGHMVQGRIFRPRNKEQKQYVLPEDEWIIVENTHAQIINQEVFDMARKRLEENVVHPQNRYNMYAGFLKCPDCGRKMGRIDGKRQAMPAFHCITYREQSKTACTRHYIEKTDLQAAILDAIRTQIKALSAIENIVEEIGGSQKIYNSIKRYNSEIGKREQLYNQALLEKAALFIDWKSGSVKNESYNQKKLLYDEKLNNWRNDINTLKQVRETVCNGVDFAYSYFDRFLKFKEITSVSRMVLVDLVDVVYVHEGGDVEVVFLHKDENEKVLAFIRLFL